MISKCVLQEESCIKNILCIKFMNTSKCIINLIMIEEYKIREVGIKISTNQQCQFFVSLLKYLSNFYSYLAHLAHAMSISVRPYNTSNYFIQVANCAQKGKHVVSR